ncbi:hypothetical protein AB833_05705 [Chromatiales bacterium (ex Bugula neritina AB1)]|nr:hypothetical protein AB833_05705 [Chromatiales bacterium (ex Bugula neritina AB1)]
MNNSKAAAEIQNSFSNPSESHKPAENNTENAVSLSHLSAGANTQKGPEAASTSGESSGWSKILGPVTGVITLCMLCCALPYLLLFTGLVGTSTAAYLSSKAGFLMGIAVVTAAAFVFIRRKLRHSAKKGVA